MPDSHDLEALLLTHIQPFENLTHSTNTCSIPFPPFQHSDLLRNSFLLNEKEGKKLHPYNSQVSSPLAAVGMIFNSFCIKLLLSFHFISDLSYTVLSDITAGIQESVAFPAVTSGLYVGSKFSESLISLRKLIWHHNKSVWLLFVKKDLLGDFKKRTTTLLLGSTLNGLMSRELPVHGITCSKREQLSSGKLLAAKLELLVIYRLGGNIVAGQRRWGNSLHTFHMQEWIL